MVLSGYQLHYVSRLPFVVIWRILFKIREIQNTSTLLNLNVLPLLPQPFLDMHLSSLSLSRVSLLPIFITENKLKILVVLYYSKIMCGFSTVELLTSYGYSLSIFIPISFAWMIPFEFIRWTLVIIGAVISGSVVCLPIWQGLKEGFGCSNRNINIHLSKI